MSRAWAAGGSGGGIGDNCVQVVCQARPKERGSTAEPVNTPRGAITAARSCLWGLGFNLQGLQEICSPSEM